MTQKNDGDVPRQEVQDHHRRVRSVPAGIRTRVEPDPVDVALGYAFGAHDDNRTATASPDTTATPGSVLLSSRHRGGDSDSDSDSDSDGDGDTTRPHSTTGDSDSGGRRHDTATGDSDTGGDIPAQRQGGDSDTASPPPPAVATGGPPVGDTTATHGEGDMITATSRRRGTRPPGQPDEEKMKSQSFSLPPSLITRLRSAQWHTQLEPDGHANLSEFVRAQLDREVRRLERKYNGGKPFPVVERLPTGPSPTGAVRGAELRARRRRRQDGSEGEKKNRTTKSDGA